MPELTGNALPSLLRCRHCGTDVSAGLVTGDDVAELETELLDQLHQRHLHDCAAYREARPMPWLAWAALGFVMVLLAAFGVMVWGVVVAVRTLFF